MPARHLLPLVMLALACSPRSEQANLPPPASSPGPEPDPGSLARAADGRPSIVMVVLDTVRADAVSSYGAVSGTTPYFDALAERGTRFAHAFAPAPWTLPSHATLFTGLRVDEHGVGLDGVFESHQGLEMLAEVLRDAGYETAGFAENALISADFGLDQGFDAFAAPNDSELDRATAAGDLSFAFFGLVQRVREWHQGRDRSRPYFLFVNVLDAHDPYIARDENPWVPGDVDPSEIEFYAGPYQRRIAHALCRRAPPERAQAVLRGLYLGDVAAADAKLGRILQVLDAEAEKLPRITVVTSDHGEHLGERGLSGHRYTVRTPALHVPLAITGAPSLAPGVVEQAVSLEDLRPSLLCWALGEGCPAALGGTDANGSAIIGVWSDEMSVDLTTPERRQIEDSQAQGMPVFARSGCQPEDRVFGRLVSLIRYPMKINWYEGQPPTLHDLSWDPWERSDLMGVEPEQGAELLEEIEAFVETRILDRPRPESPGRNEKALRRLEALGYIE